MNSKNWYIRFAKQICPLLGIVNRNLNCTVYFLTNKRQNKQIKNLGGSRKSIRVGKMFKQKKMKITEYKIIEDDFKKNVEELVNQAIADGWQPYGNLVVYILPSNNSCWYVQAMTK